MILVKRFVFEKLKKEKKSFYHYFAYNKVGDNIMIMQLSPFMYGVHRNGQCYKGTISQRNYRKMTIQWSFSYDSFVKFHAKKFGSHNITVLYPNLCYNKVCYKGTILTVPV